MTYKLALVLTWVAFAAMVTGYAVAQSVRGPDSLPGCIYNSSPPTLTTGQVTALQCDSAGRLKTTAS